MREILFRGQTRRLGERLMNVRGDPMPSNWVYGGILQGKGDKSVIYGSEDMNNISAANIDKWIVYTDTIGQYTGLTDKNGGKIFEGDILGSPNGTLGIVEWQELWCRYLVTVGGNWQTMDDCDNWKLVGNIYDDHGLLEIN